MKKKIIALLLCISLLCGILPAPTYAADAEAADAALCETCGTSPCTCDEVSDICLIGYLDKSGSISFFDLMDAEKSVAASDCPDYLILTQKIIKKSLTEDTAGNTQLVETVWYKADSLDDTFWSGVVSQYAFIEAKYFTAVTSAAGLYTTFGSNELTLYKDLATATDVKTAVLAEEYVVADLCYEETLGSWFVKLTPDENWPEAASGYVWTSAFSMVTLTQTATRQPEVPACTCGQDVHTEECPLYEDPFADIEDEEAREAVRIFYNLMQSETTELMLTYFEADQALFEEWGKIPLDAPDVPVAEETAFAEAEKAVMDALETDAENLETAINDKLVELVYAYVDADDLLGGIDAYFGADDPTITNYKLLEAEADLGMQAYATPNSPEAVGVVTPNIKINLFNYGRNINDLGKLQFSLSGDNELDKGGTSYNDQSVQGYPKYNNLDADGYPSIAGFYDSKNNTDTFTASAIDLKPYFNTSLTESEYDNTNTNYTIRYYPVDTVQLFSYDPTTGTYTYDSATNHAYYDSSNNSLTAYDYALRTFTTIGEMAGQGSFIPFNSPSKIKQEWVGYPTWYEDVLYPYGNAIQLTDGNKTPITANLNGATVVDTDIIEDAQNTYSKKATKVVPYLYALNGGDNQADMAFGMSIEFDFVIPKGGQLNGEDMTFTFRGDDDLVVYIDEYPVLNLGGPRGITEGSINFASGQVWASKEYFLDDKDNSNPSRCIDMNDIEGLDLSDYSKHTLKIFYMERWGAASNCFLQFNMPVLVDGEPSVAKSEAAGLNSGLAGKQAYTFILKDASGNPLEGKTYTLTRNGNPTGETGTTDENGYFTLKDDEIATFTNMTLGQQYTVTEVSGNYETTYKVNSGGTVSGNQTPVQMVEEAGTMILFTNTWKTGDLVISKNVRMGGAYIVPSANDQEFTFKVEFGDEGTYSYTGSKSGTLTSGKTITLKHGESVTFADIPAGVTYTVTETSIAGFTADDATKTGKIVENTTVKAAFTNTYTAELGSLKITKHIGKKYENDTLPGGTFTFTVAGTASVQPGTYTVKIGNETKKVTVKEGGAIDSFTVNVAVATNATSNSITIENMPAGDYTVTEKNHTQYDCDTEAKEAKVQNNKTAEVDITNSFLRTYGSLTINKQITNTDDAAITETFTFIVTTPDDVTVDVSKYTVTPATTLTKIDDHSFSVQITASAEAQSTGDASSVKISGLPSGDYTVTEQEKFGFDPAFDSDAEEATVRIRNSDEEVTCTNSFPVYTGSLTVSKTVEKTHPGDTLPDDTFNFTITLTPSDAAFQVKQSYTYTVGSGDNAPTGVITKDGAKTISVSLKNGESVTISGLPVGGYTVVEAPDLDYTTTSTGATGTIEHGETKNASFTNTYKKHLGNLSITKTVVGENAPDTAFTFTVSGAALSKASYKVTIGEAEAACNVIDGELTITLKAGQTAVIHDLDLAAYQVVEGATGSEFVLTSSSGTTGTVSAEDSAAAAFTNTYVPRGDLKVTKFIDRGLHDNVPIDTDKEFTFTVNLAYALDVEETYTAKTYTVGVAEPTATSSLTLSDAKELTFQLKHNQYIVIEGLPAVAYTVTETQETGYLTPNFVGGASGTIPEKDTAEVTCYNPVQLDPGDLQITKVIDDTTDNQSAPKDQAFVFTVTLRNVTGTMAGPYTVNYTCDPEKGTINTVDGVTTYTMTGGTSVTLVTAVTPEEGLDGEYEFALTLYDGLTATVEDLPPSAYHVEENDYTQEGFVGTWTGDQTGMIGGKKTGNTDPLAAVTCTNTYPINSNGVLIIIKQVKKDYERDVLPADTFTFTVTPTDGNRLEGEYTVKISKVNDKAVVETTTTVVASNNQLVVSIPYTAAELVMELNDGRTKRLTIEGLPLGQYEVEETADADYNQSPTGLKHSVSVGTNPGEAVFINEYKRHLGRLQITKELTDANEDDGQEFLFHILNSSDEVITSVTLKAGESKTVYDLPLGSYTVVEDVSWSWRYDLTTITVGEQTFTETDRVPVALEVGTDAHVTFTNDWKQNKWLNYFVNFLNEFISSSDAS